MYDMLASYYDAFQDMDYESLVDYYERLFSHFGIAPKLMLDLGCGTGNVTLALAKRGYDMIGLDASEQMLQEASKKARDEGQNILFLCQDMTAFELYDIQRVQHDKEKRRLVKCKSK